MYLYWLRRQVHVSWWVALIMSGVVLGVIACQYIDVLVFRSMVWLLVGTALASVILWCRWIACVPLALLAGCLIGVWRGSLVQGSTLVYQNLYGHELLVEGRVLEDTETNARGQLVMRLGDLSVNGNSISGKVWATTKTTVGVRRSDRVHLYGTLQEGFGSFNGTLYQAVVQRVERPEPGDVALRLRDWFADAVRLAISEPEASLGIGYLVGQRRDLPPELDESLRMAGLTHIVVASGYNLTILVRFSRRIFVRISKYLATLSASAMIVSFVAVTGISPSMSRAGLIAGLSLAAWYYGRKIHPLVLLPFAAAVTLLVSPSYGWSDLGWQLSFAAFAGVMIVAPLGQAYFFGGKKPGAVRQIVGETMAAYLVTLPLLVVTFGEFSNVAIIANILVLPLVPLAMALTFAVGVGVLLMPSLAGLVGVPAEVLLGYMTSVAQYLTSQSWTMSEVSISWVLASVMYVGLMACCGYMWRRTRLNLRDTNIIE